MVREASLFVLLLSWPLVTDSTKTFRTSKNTAKKNHPCVFKLHWVSTWSRLVLALPFGFHTPIETYHTFFMIGLFLAIPHCYRGPDRIPERQSLNP